MGGMASRERFFAALDGRNIDRLPVFCANQTATYEQMNRVGFIWPEAHYRAKDMAGLAIGAYSILGFDAVRVPFCQTIEAEALGCTIKDGGKKNIPSIKIHPYKIGDQPHFPEDFLERGRIPELIKAVKILKENVGDKVVVIGGIIGPFSIAASLIEPQKILVASFKNPDSIQPYLEVAKRAGVLLGKALINAGADLICIEDMAASLDLISPAIYRKAVFNWEKKQIEELEYKTILHICGKLDRVIEDVAMTGTTALSVDINVDVPKAKDILTRQERFIPLMGGVNAAHTLFSGSPDEVKNEVRKAILDGYSFIAPSCSIAPGTPTENLLAMVEAVSA